MSRYKPWLQEEISELVSETANPGHFRKDGLTKREYFAAAAMQGIIASDNGLAFEEAAVDAVRFADALVWALERKSE